MNDAAGLQMDSTINERVGGDLHVNTHEERKGGEIVDVSSSFHLMIKSSLHSEFCLSLCRGFECTEKTTVVTDKVLTVSSCLSVY